MLNPEPKTNGGIMFETLTYDEWADNDDDAQAETGERLPTDNTAEFFGQL